MGNKLINSGIPIVFFVLLCPVILLSANRNAIGHPRDNDERRPPLAPVTNGIPNFEAIEDGPLVTIQLEKYFSNDKKGKGKSNFSYSLENLTNGHHFSYVDLNSKSGRLRLKTKKDEYGTSVFTIRVTDKDKKFVEASFSFIIKPVNDQPSFEASNPPAVQQGSGRQVVSGWAKFNPGAGNENNQNATYQVSSVEKPNLFQELPKVSSDGTLTYHVKDNLFGSSTFGVQVRDSGGTANGGKDQSGIKIFRITVNEVIITNTPPFFVSKPVVSVLEDESYEYQISVNDRETPAHELSIRALALPSWLDFSLGKNGTALLKGTPTNNDVGVHQVTLNVSDGNLNTDQKFTITVTEANDAPFFVSNPNTGGQIGIPYIYNIVVGDVDKDDVLAIEALSLPEWLDLTVTGEKTAVISGTPEENHAGSYEIIIIVTDKEKASAQQTFTLIVNRQPVVRSFSIETSEDEEHLFTETIFAENYNDVNDIPLKAIKILDVPEYGKLMAGTIEIGRNSEINAIDIEKMKYIPVANYFGNDKFSWAGSNGIVYSSNIAMAGIALHPVEDAPQLTNIESGPLIFVPGKDEPKNITNSIEIFEPDGENIVGAQVIFNPRSFIPEEDILLFQPFHNISGAYSRNAGILTLTGSASFEDYQKAIRSIRYANLNENPSYEVREFNIYVDDGKKLSNFVRRDIQLVDGLVELEIPSAFTPNGDGVNDLWLIKNIDLYPECTIKVFNRSGQLVYSSGYDENIWDGRMNGIEVPAGTYFYFIDLHIFNKQYSGAVTIVK